MKKMHFSFFHFFFFYRSRSSETQFAEVIPLLEKYSTPGFSFAEEEKEEREEEKKRREEEKKREEEERKRRVEEEKKRREEEERRVENEKEKFTLGEKFLLVGVCTGLFLRFIGWI